MLQLGRRTGTKCNKKTFKIQETLYRDKERLLGDRGRLQGHFKTDVLSWTLEAPGVSQPWIQVRRAVAGLSQPAPRLGSREQPH